MRVEGDGWRVGRPVNVSTEEQVKESHKWFDAGSFFSLNTVTLFPESQGILDFILDICCKTNVSHSVLEWSVAYGKLFYCFIFLSLVVVTSIVFVSGFLLMFYPRYTLN